MVKQIKKLIIATVLAGILMPIAGVYAAAEQDKKEKAQNTSIDAQWWKRELVYALWDAVKEGDIKEVKTILDKAAQFTKTTVADFNTSFQSIINATSDNGLNALVISIQKGHDNITDLLLERGARVNENLIRKTALETAVEYNNKLVVRKLIHHGADVNDGSFNSLHGAILHHNIDIVKMLLTAKALVNKYNLMNYTPLTLAIMSEQPEIVRLLIKNKADLNQKNNSNNYTSLMMAVSNKNENIVIMLTAAGADLDVQNEYYDGKTALDMAEPKMRELILEASQVLGYIGLAETATQNPTLACCLPISPLRALIEEYLIPVYQRELLNNFVMRQIKGQEDSDSTKEERAQAAQILSKTLLKESIAQKIKTACAIVQEYEEPEQSARVVSHGEEEAKENVQNEKIVCYICSLLNDAGSSNCATCGTLLADGFYV